MTRKVAKLTFASMMNQGKKCCLSLNVKPMAVNISRKRKILKPTEKERASFAETKKRRKEVEGVLLDGFSDEEKQAVSDYLDRIYNNLARS